MIIYEIYKWKNANKNELAKEKKSKIHFSMTKIFGEKENKKKEEITRSWDAHLVKAF